MKTPKNRKMLYIALGILVLLGAVAGIVYAVLSSSKKNGGGDDPGSSPPPSWDCDRQTNACSDPHTGQGQYQKKSDCDKYCKPKPPTPGPGPGPPGQWNKGLNVTYYYDCSGQTCDAPLLQPWDQSKFIAGPGYKILDPKDYGGSIYGEKMWIYGAASDGLANLLGDNIPGLGYPDSSSGPNKGCGRSILIKNPAATNSDWTVLVMRKNRCPPSSNGCEAGKIHMDLMIPGFDNLQYSTNPICGNPGTALSKDQSIICGALTNPSMCTECHQLPQDFINGCQLFVEWGWPTGNPTCDWQIVDTPNAFIQYTKTIQLS